MATIGLTPDLRRAEQRTFAFPEPVRRVEADWRGLRLPGGEVSYRVEVPATVDVRAWTGAGAVAASSSPELSSTWLSFRLPTQGCPVRSAPPNREPSRTVYVVE